MARCIEALRKDPQGDFAKEILSAIQRGLDDLDFQINASAFMEWDASVEEAVVDFIEYAGEENEQRIVDDSGGDSVTFIVPIKAGLRIQAAFDFSVHDSIDKDYVSIGGTVEEVTVEHRYEVTLTVIGKGGEDVEIDDAVVNPATRLRQVDFDHVEPFYEPDPD